MLLLLLRRRQHVQGRGRVPELVDSGRRLAEVGGGGRQVLRGDGRKVRRQVPRRRRGRLLLLVQERDLLERLSLLPLLKFGNNS